MVDGEIVSQIITILGAAGAIILTAGVSYYFGRRRDREFSLIERLWGEKHDSLQKIITTLEMYPQFLIYLKGIIDVRSSNDPPKLRLIEIFTTADLLEKQFGLVISSNPQAIIRTPGAFDKHTLGKTNAQLEQEVQITCDELVHVIQHELTTLSQSTQMLAYSLDLVVFDETLLDDVRQNIADYVRLCLMQIANNSGISNTYEVCRERTRAFRIRARRELDRTRTAKLQKGVFERNRDNGIILSPDVEQWIDNKVRSGAFISKSQAIDVAILHMMKK